MQPLPERVARCVPSLLFSSITLEPSRLEGDFLGGQVSPRRRSEVNLKDDRVSYKIREASLQKIPYVVVVGEREAASGTVSPRSHDRGELDEMQLDAFLALLSEETARS